MPRRKGAPEVRVHTVDIARCVAENGVTFFAAFNKTAKTTAVSIGRELRDDGDSFVVSNPSIRAFAKLLLKHAKES